MNAPAAGRWDLFWMLVRVEFRMRDQGTWFGFAWSLLHPLLHFAVLYLLFLHWMGPLVPDYGAYLMIGIVQWNFFASGTAAGLTSLRRKAGLVCNFSFPRSYVVLSAVFAVLASHLLELAVLLAVLVAMGAAPSVGWLWLLPLAAAELALVCALSGLLALGSVGVRDMERVWSILLYALFFATPVFYVSTVVGPAGAWLLRANPLALLIEATRGVLLGGASWPGAAALACGALAAAAAALVVAAFPSMSKGLAERL